MGFFLVPSSCQDHPVNTTIMMLSVQWQVRHLTILTLSFPHPRLTFLITARWHCSEGNVSKLPLMYHCIWSGMLASSVAFPNPVLCSLNLTPTPPSYSLPSGWHLNWKQASVDWVTGPPFADHLDLKRTSGSFMVTLWLGPMRPSRSTITWDYLGLSIEQLKAFKGLCAPCGRRMWKLPKQRSPIAFISFNTTEFTISLHRVVLRETLE